MTAFSRTIRLGVCLALCTAFAAFAQNGETQDEHDRQIKADTERNTKYHNNADDYPKNTTSTPAPSSNSKPRYVAPEKPVYVEKYYPSPGNRLAAEAATEIAAAKAKLAAGDLSGAVTLGNYIYAGMYIQGNPQQAYNYWQSAADEYPYAAYQVGRMDYEGDAVPQNKPAGLRSMASAAERGNPEALRWLAAKGLDSHGVVIPPTLAETVALPPIRDRSLAMFEQRTADRRKPTASELPGLQKEAAEYDKVKLIEDGAKQKKAESKLDYAKLYLLGVAYLHGDGVPANPERAKNLLMAAAMHDHPEANEQVAWAFCLIERAERQAGEKISMSGFNWWAGVMDRTSPTPVSAYLVAASDMYPNPEELRTNLQKAASGGITDAAIELAYLELRVHPASPEGLATMTKAAATDANAMYALGSIYKYGLYGVPRDPVKGSEWLGAAAAKNQPQAQKLLATK